MHVGSTSAGVIPSISSLILELYAFVYLRGLYGLGFSVKGSGLHAKL